jgi:hypothetical protein
MKKKTKKFLSKKKIVPIAIFSDTDASDLVTGYSVPSRFNLAAVVIWKNDRFHVFSDKGKADVSYVLEDNTKTNPLPLWELKEFIQDSFLVGYDLEKFGIPLLEEYLNAEEDFELNVEYYDILQESFKAYEKHSGEGGKRFRLFQLAFWNACENSINVADLIGFTHMKMIHSWHYGQRRKGIKKLKTEAVWCAELAHRIFRRPQILVRDHRTNKKVRIPIQSIGNLTSEITGD